MGKDYNRMQNCLFYPFSQLGNLYSNPNATIRPFSTSTPSDGNPAGISDNSDTRIPNAGSYTCPQMGFMVAFNELSNATDSATTYKGRRGAAKMVIFETDGVPNTVCTASLTASGPATAGYWFYDNVGGASWVSNSTTLAATPKQRARNVVRQIVALDTASPPGLSTARSPARVHAIGFGELFGATTPSSMKPAALRFLAAVQIDGKTSPPPSGWDPSTRVDDDSLDYNAHYVNLEPYKVITGNYTQRIEKLREALERIMQGGVQVALIQ
jgi:hypothetical protein